MQDFTFQPIVMECTIKRVLPTGQGGSDIDMGDGSIIAFRQHTDGRHIGIIANPDHFARLMQIPESFRMIGVYTAPAESLGAAAPAPVAKEATARPLIDVATDILNGNEVSLMDLDHDEFDGVPLGRLAEAAQAIVEPEGQATNYAFAGERVPLEGLTIQDVRMVFERELGTKAHPATKLDTLVAKIMAARNV